MNSKISDRYSRVSQTPKSDRKFSSKQRALTIQTPEKTIRPDHLNGVERIISPFRPFTARSSQMGFYSKGDGFYSPNAKLGPSESASRLSTIDTRQSYKTESVDFHASGSKQTKKDLENAANLRRSGEILTAFKKELGQLLNEKKHLVKLISNLKNNIKMCEAETVRAVHEQERWHNEALKQARGIEFRANEIFIIERAKQMEAEQIKLIEKDLKDSYNKNKKCVSDIENERNAIIELQNYMSEMKREIAATLRDKEKLRQDLIVATRLNANLQQRLEYNELEKNNLNLCVDVANSKAESLQQDLDDGNSVGKSSDI